MRRIILALALMALAGMPAAAAHPFTDSTVPEQYSNAPIGISEVVVVYSEAVELGFSVLKVFDSTGEQIDHRDVGYHSGENSLMVSTPPLADGTYTVTSKVLSKVDGHLVDYTFVFAVGDATVDRTDVQSSDLVFLPEAAARFPGLAGQTIVLGAVIASIFVWGTQRKDIGAELAGLKSRLHGRFMSLVGVGLVLVFASNILMLSVQTLRLEAPALDVLQTTFGTTWSIRMGITVALLGVWFALDRTGAHSARAQAPLLGLGLALIGTTTMLGHAMASGQAPAVILDYTHNLVAAAWIGGVVFFAFALLPSLGRLASEGMMLAAIPRFSILATISVGIVIVTGPTLLWFLESNVDSIASSTYGKLIALKIVIAAAMIGMGAYHQFGIQRRAEHALGTIRIGRKLSRALRAEAVMGIALLGVVALLANGTLPAGEVGAASVEAPRGFSTVEFAGQTRLGIDISPFGVGANAIRVAVTTLDGTQPEDLEGIKVKVSNPQRNIAPISVPMELRSGTFEGGVTFGFSGRWQLEVEALYTGAGNDAAILDLLVKPPLSGFRAELVEYDFPEPAVPLYPIYDGRDSIWISDADEPRIWEFSIPEKSFTMYGFEGSGSNILTIDDQGKVWFTDIQQGRIGYVNPAGDSEIIELPVLEPLSEKSFPISLAADSEGGVWVSIINKNALIRYDQYEGTFEEYELPTLDSAPFAVAIDQSGRVWFTQQAAGQVGYLDPHTAEIREFAPDIPLATPETITFDTLGNLWIAEHQMGGGLVRYSPVLDSFERIPAPDDDALPNAAVFDRYENVWYAMHTVDKITGYDPHRGETLEVPVPTVDSWILFTTSDGDGNVWVVEQKPNKLAMLELSEVPGMQAPLERANFTQYADVASPLVAMGIVASSLFFVKAVRDKRRIDSLVYG